MEPSSSYESAGGGEEEESRSMTSFSLAMCGGGCADFCRLRGDREGEEADARPFVGGASPDADTVADESTAVLLEAAARARALGLGRTPVGGMLEREGVERERERVS